MVKRHIHWLGKGMVRDDEIGPFVFYTDYATLKAERDRLKQSNADSQHDMDRLIAEREALREALRSILNDCESVLEQFYPESIIQARTALAKVE